MFPHNGYGGSLFTQHPDSPYESLGKFNPNGLTSQGDPFILPTITRDIDPSIVASSTSTSTSTSTCYNGSGSGSSLICPNNVSTFGSGSAFASRSGSSMNNNGSASLNNYMRHHDNHNGNFELQKELLEIANIQKETQKQIAELLEIEKLQRLNNISSTSQSLMLGSTVSYNWDSGSGSMMHLLNDKKRNLVNKYPIITEYANNKNISPLKIAQIILNDPLLNNLYPV